FSAGVGTALYAFDLNTGNQLWRDMLGPPGGAYRETPTFDNGRIFVSGSLGFLQAIDAASGQFIWSIQVPDQSFTPPVALDGRVFIGRTYSVAAYDENDGSLLWQQPYA